ncbi:PNGase F N-terminal domain-containing protein [Fulvivirga sediminis]|uniref:Peptide-N-glycosidase n=1 Tax=Fulvivirga sediminis TaxID=2803949 RepID=A0A937K173_9BACT|nr:PNGase F N-terminal domain-containing protein [Fulvivirga sediminis]MBL3657040.1 peptide-N-glycosidase [Fulvivirga sediminis]
MYRIITLLLLLSTPSLIIALANPSDRSGKVEYSVWHNGEIDRQRDLIIMEYNNSISKTWTDQSGKNLIPEVPKQYNYHDYTNQTVYRQAIFMDGQAYYTQIKFNELEGFKAEGPPAKILGYNCQKYTGSSFSNKIELWVTTDTGLKGTPVLSFPYTKGLVLKYVSNENYGWEATNIEFYKKKNAPKLMPDDLGKEIDQVNFGLRLANAFVKEIQIFEDEQINWGDNINNPEGNKLNQLYRFAGGTIIAKKIKLPEVPDGTTVFAEIVEKSNGDAYDRTGSAFIIPTGKEKSFLDGLKSGVDVLPKYISSKNKTYQGVVSSPTYDPVIELMRFFTPFGVNHFNDKRDVGITWADSVSYKQDVSHLLPVLQGECWIAVFIGNYDAGGHKVSLNLKYHLNQQEKSSTPKQKYWVQSLFNTTNVMEMAGQEYGTMFKNDTLKVEFDVPPGVKKATFRYISTGHGGWEGGDEFVPKKNQLFLDEEPFFSYTPWRVDCGTYRSYNPASGNFWNGLSSSDYSRSGWCPGSVSQPYYIDIENLTPGKHTIEVYIPIGEREGNMFSAWNISGVLIGQLHNE